MFLKDISGKELYFLMETIVSRNQMSISKKTQKQKKHSIKQQPKNPQQETKLHPTTKILVLIIFCLSAAPGGQ